MTETFADAVGLSNRPVGPNAVQWSADGVLAVAAAHSVVLLSPGNLLGPRGFATPGNECDVTMLQAPGAPKEPSADALHEVTHLRVAAMVSPYPALQSDLFVRSVSWSPAGCAQTAGCLLAMVTSDHQVLVYGPPAEPQSQWQQVADLSQQLLTHLEASGWQHLEQPPPPPEVHSEGAAEGAAAAADDGGVLRLRGGGSSKRKRGPGAGGKAQAAAAAAEGAAGKGAAAASVAEGPVFLQEAAFDAAVGQAVEAMSREVGLEGCWFRGTVERLHHGWALVAFEELTDGDEEGSPPLREWFPVPGQRQGLEPVPHGSGVVHRGKDGPQLRPVPPQEECCAGEARAVGDSCDCFLNGGWWEQCRVVGLNAEGSAVKVELQAGQELEKHSVALEHCRRTLRFAGGRWLASAPPSAAAAAAAAVAAAGEQEEEEERPAKKRRGGGKAGGSSSKKGKKGTAVAPEAAAEEPPAGDAGESDTDEAAAAAAAAGALMAAAASAPGGGKGKGKGRRSAVAVDGPGAVPHFAAAASEKTVGKPPAAAAAAKKTPGKAAAAEYQVPADFDSSVLPGVDLTSVKTARTSIPQAFARRFLLLRRSVPAAELPSYPQMSSHLKGRDAELISQVVAEILHAHGAGLEELNPQLNSAKWINTDGRGRLRHVWDRTRNKLLGGFKVCEEDVAEAEEEEEEEEEETEDGGGGSGAPSGQEDLEASGGEGEGGSSRRRVRRIATGGRSGSAPTQLDFPPHVPADDFSWRDLPGVDPSNDASAKRTMALSAVKRFITLRAEFDEDELPEYPTSSSHLKGRDAWLVDRVTREFCHAYSHLLADMKWTVKAFQTTWLSRLRDKWDRVGNKVAEGFSLEPEPVEQDVLLAVGDEGTPGAAATEQEGQEGQPVAATPARGRGPRLQHRQSTTFPRKGAGAGGSIKKGRQARVQEEGEAEEESDGGSQGAAARLMVGIVRHRKDLRAATAAARSRQAGGAVLSSAAYQRRALGISSLCCSWSPVVPLPAGAAEHGAADGQAAAAEQHEQRQAEQQQHMQPQQQQQQGEQQQQDGQEQRRCCFLAVGAKGGRIWLWRYRLPGRYSVHEPQRGRSHAFHLVACLPGPVEAWVTSLAWQALPGGSTDGSTSGSSQCGSFVLAAGYSDGSVVLHGASAGHLAALPSLPAQQQQQQQQQREAAAPAAIQRWADVCLADQRGVTTLALQLAPSSSSSSSGGSGNGSQGRHLLVAVGKMAGSVAVWRSGDVSMGSTGSSAEHAAALGKCTGSLAAVGVQGTRPVTGLAWLPPQQQQEGQPLLIVSTQEGTVACWRLAEGPSAAAPAATATAAAAPALPAAAAAAVAPDSGRSGNRLALVRAEGAPQPCVRRKKREQGHCALGLAVSPGGLFVAVARLSLAPLAEMIKSMQVHERVVQGFLQLDCLAGPGAPLDPTPAVEAALAALTSSSGSGNISSIGEAAAAAAAPALASTAAWEVAAMLRLRDKWTSTSGGGGGSASEAGLVPPMASRLLQSLEQPALEAVQQRGRQEAGAGDAAEGGDADAVLERVGPGAWRMLQLATALRHLLDPSRVARSQQLRAKKQPRKTGGDAAQPPLLPLVRQIKEEEAAAARQAQQAAVQAEERARQEAERARQEAEQARQAEERAQQEAEQARQQAEQVAQHGAFASLMAAPPFQEPPPPPAQQPQPQQAQQQQEELPQWQQELADAALEQGQEDVLAEWAAATERNEMLLLQRQLHSSLVASLPDDAEVQEMEDGMEVDGGSHGGSGGGRAAAASATTAGGMAGGSEEERLSWLLRADWITLNNNLLPEMDMLAARVYMHAGVEVPGGGSMPLREASALFGGTSVPVAGAGVAAATSAYLEGATLPRCPASLLLCEQRPHWACRACGRKYRRPAVAPAPQGAAGGGAPGCAAEVPVCTFCGLMLGPSLPSILFSPPCCA